MNESSGQSRAHAVGGEPIEFLRHAAPGTLIYGMAVDNDGDDVQIEVLVRESDAELARLPEPPQLQLRAGVIETGLLPVPVVLLRFGAGLPVYQSFWNLHHQRAADEPSIIELMGRDPCELLFKLVGDSGTVVSMFACRHPLSPFFRNYQRQSRKLPAWSDDDFRAAIDELQTSYPTAAEMWDAFLQPEG